MLLILFCSVVSYIVGSFPFGLWVGQLWKNVDIRTLGSKNIGATNVLRVLGPGPGVLVFALDTLKGCAGIILARAIVPDIHIWVLILIGLLGIIGHTFSLFLRFKGGKGVATSFGALMALNPPAAGAALAVWIIAVTITRYVSVASIAAGISLPFAAYYFGSEDRWWMVGLSVALMLLIMIKHRANIQRLLAGTEAKIGQRVVLENSPENAEVK